jgi:hypothetical protein
MLDEMMRIVMVLLMNDVNVLMEQLNDVDHLQINDCVI